MPKLTPFADVEHYYPYIQSKKISIIFWALYSKPHKQQIPKLFIHRLKV